ncbi:solute carrier family 13 member 2-like isoform X2 [Tachypleus tridentatus]|uniref:solute carrier family 13 member 2-like isoform X2 n=1 Tax=Tachypleus tridentatus TaxID=6853 RepID=UPI003FD4B097
MNSSEVRKRIIGALSDWNKIIITVGAPLILLPLPLSAGTQESKCGFLVLLMAVYWMTEAIPLPVTGLLPVVFLPLMGIMDTTATCYPYMRDAIMIGLGGILVAIAVEHCNLHQRIALRVLLSVGTTPRWLMLGFMMTSSTLSMWIGPTPTVAMMIPIVDAVLKELDNSIDLPGFDTPTPDREGSELGDSTEALNVLHIECQTPQEQNVRKLRNVMMLTMCYAANVGGAGTLPATAPNLVFKFVLEDLYPSFGGVSFTTWMVFNTPGIILCVGIIWFLTVFFVLRKIPQTSTHEQQSQVKNFIRLKYKELGSWTVT